MPSPIMSVLRGFIRGWDRFVDGVMVLAGILFWCQMLIVNEIGVKSTGMKKDGLRLEINW